MPTLVGQSIDSEVIVCDDNSDATASDENFNICKLHGAEYLSNPGPFGVANARNYGVSQSKGEYLAFCDDDDYWLSSKLENQMSALYSGGGAWVYSTVIVVNKFLSPIGVNFGREVEVSTVYTHNPIPGGCSSVMAERRLFESVGGFDSNLKMYADWDLWIRMYENSEPVVSQAPDVFYVQHDQQMSKNNQLAIDELEIVLKKHDVDRKMYGGTLTGIDRWVALRCTASNETLLGLSHVLRKRNYMDYKILLLLAKILIRRPTRKLSRGRKSSSLAEESVASLLHELAEKSRSSDANFGN